MIIDLERFIEAERPYWERLEAVLDKLARDHVYRMNLDEVREFHYLYERVSSDLARISTFASEQETRRYLSSLVARAYSEIHEGRRDPHRFRPIHWFFRSFPQTFRRHIRAFHVAAAVTLVGCLFGGMAIYLDPTAKEAVMPFEHLLQRPSERVAQEEKQLEDRLDGMKAQGAAWYMTHNTQVAVYTMAMGVTWGIGTVIMLFYTGIMLGGVAVDFVLAGEAKFLVGWLLPHGSVEIPAILLAGQAGFVMASSLIGWGKRISLTSRLRRIMPDLVTLIGGVAVMLVWAGVIESFLSQYHEPVIPYSFKIGFGAAELVLLIIFLGWSGRAGKRCVEPLPVPDTGKGAD